MELDDCASQLLHSVRLVEAEVVRKLSKSCQTVAIN